jgi:phosphoribosylanthranilate isomerase
VAELGVDAIGFVFANSPRQISIQAAAGICQALSPFVTRVGVFVNSSLKTIKSAIKNCQLDVVQLHGDETPEFCRQVPVRVVKTFKVGSGADLEEFIKTYEPVVQAFLFDTFLPEQVGGTGQIFDWGFLSHLKLRKFWILAGGLTPENVAQAIRKSKPYAVDVASGVESSPGKKNLQKVRAFIEEVRRASESVNKG